jgi:hypothetical protein
MPVQAASVAVPVQAWRCSKASATGTVQQCQCAGAPMAWQVHAGQCSHASSSMPVQPRQCGHGSAAMPVHPWQCSHANSSMPVQPCHVSNNTICPAWMSVTCSGGGCPGCAVACGAFDEGCRPHCGLWAHSRVAVIVQPCQRSIASAGVAVCSITVVQQCRCVNAQLCRCRQPV